jgi:hypothetical protein
MEPLGGGIVLAITLLDVLLTVPYARAGSGLLAPRLARGLWRIFRGLSRRRHAGMLSYCGPAQLVALVLMWGVLLTLGSGLVIHPALGTGVTSNSGATTYLMQVYQALRRRSALRLMVQTQSSETDDAV